MLFALQMELKDGRIRESFPTSMAVIALLAAAGSPVAAVLYLLGQRDTISDGLFTVDLRDRLLPSEQASLVPFTVEHFFRLLLDLQEIHQRLRPSEEVFQVVGHTLYVL